MFCEHPICSKPIQSICSTHCHWSLCVEHLDEHRRNLLNDFERSLRDLMKPTNDLSEQIEEQRKSLDEFQKSEIQRIEKRFRNEIDQIEEKFAELDRFQEEYQHLATSFEQIKSNRKVLTRDDAENLNRLIEKVRSNDKNENTIDFCPLTSLNLFGLKNEHRVRLCPSGKKIRNLIEHFRNYHHLNLKYAEALIEAVRSNRDPTSTKIFPSENDESILDEKFPCPFESTSSNSGIRSTPCSSFLTDKSIRQHLKLVHRLSSRKISKILQLS